MGNAIITIAGNNVKLYYSGVCASKIATLEDLIFSKEIAKKVHGLGIHNALYWDFETHSRTSSYTPTCGFDMAFDVSSPDDANIYAAAYEVAPSGMSVFIEKVTEQLTH